MKTKQQHTTTLFVLNLFLKFVSDKYKLVRVLISCLEALKLTSFGLMNFSIKQMHLPNLPGTEQGVSQESVLLIVARLHYCLPNCYFQLVLLMTFVAGQPEIKAVVL